ncbi:hypothetical protein [Spiroplasma ixodetis]|uniref:hypothetical protein n=1 Tax=Spiroplasma ixodetis TaxID=2141 RepID=UPI002578500A|nr:hypothetical protein [Spiroplasma ixodetis]WJG70639.1 hypothetical protein SIXOD_v1c18310 [Spiroplasma ixodetis Y32]
MLENETNVQETTEPLTENNNLQQEQETKIVELENKLNKLNQEIKEKEIINIRTSPHMYLWRKQWNWMSSTMLFKQNRIV